MLDAWGIKGWIKVQCFAEDPQALLDATRWHVQPPEDGPLKRPSTATAVPRHLAVVSSRKHGDVIVAQVRGVDDRNGAEALRGLRLFLARGAFPKPRAGEYYWVDLIGLSVVNREGVALGTVRELLATGPQTTLVLTAEEDGKTIERMVPFVSVFVDKVDLPGRLITVDWQPEF